MLLLLVLVPLVLGDTCPPPSPLYSCATPSLYIMDATNDVDSATINAQIEFMEKKVLPETAADQLLTFLCYGAGRSSKPLSTSYNTNCADLQAVSRQMQTSGGNAYKLKDLMRDIANTYLSYLNNLHVQFFTASADEVDIQDATSYARLNMPNVRFTVVILRSDGVVAKAWSGFPADFVISIPPSQLATVSNLDKCLVAQSCRKSDYCPLFLTTTAAPTTTTTTATTTTTTPTTTTTTTTSSTSATTTTAATSNGPQCSCNPATVWVDVMLLFDNSAITGGHELQMMLNYAQESLNRLNIEQSTAADNFHTRMGIVVYSSTATLYSPLGTVNNANFLNIATLPYAGGNDTNLDDALDTAMSEFDGMAHRRNTRKVIIIFASDYIPGPYASPNTTDFINLNGVVIVYNGLPAGAPDSGILGSLASPGYFIRNTDDPIGDKLIADLCKANCFCPSSLTPFTMAVTGEPTAGCYLPFTQMSNFQLAKNNCKKQVTGGYISQAKSPEKSDFLIDLAGDRSILNGLSWDVIENEYLWEDGTPLGSYQPWNDNGTHTNGIDCVMVWPISQDFPWVRSDCRTSWAYVCEGIPCDSSNYCP